jgi:hypothetical protein
VDGYESRVARQLQVCFDESSSQLHRALESSKRILRSVAGCASVRDDPGRSHGLAYPNRFTLAASLGPIQGL